jgi:hypothetical protein
LREKGVNIGDNDKVLLFFGFIRKYKGLDIALQAMADQRVRDLGIKLLVAGEFYEDAAPYHDLIARLNIGTFPAAAYRLYPRQRGSSIPVRRGRRDPALPECHQSGVTPLAYHFEKPMIVSNVGGLAALVPHEQVGLVAEPDPTPMADAILRFFILGESFFISGTPPGKEQILLEPAGSQYHRTMHPRPDLIDAIGPSSSTGTGSSTRRKRTAMSFIMANSSSMTR